MTTNNPMVPGYAVDKPYFNWPAIPGLLSTMITRCRQQKAHRSPKNKPAVDSFDSIARLIKVPETSAYATLSKYLNCPGRQPMKKSVQEKLVDSVILLAFQGVALFPLMSCLPPLPSMLRVVLPPIVFCYAAYLAIFVINKRSRQ